MKQRIIVNGQFANILTTFKIEINNTTKWEEEQSKTLKGYLVDGMKRRGNALLLTLHLP